MNIAQEHPPCFNAVTGSTRQLFHILKCIGFIPRAQVQISADGIRVSVEDSRAMQGHAFLEKKLFTSYAFRPPPNPNPNPTTPGAPEIHEDNDEDATTSFSISLSALLECLQLFGADSARERNSTSTSTSSGFGGGLNRAVGGGGSGGASGGGSGGPGLGGIFDPSALRISGTCRIVYEGVGWPLNIILEESGVVTTCELTTYEVEGMEEIPIARDALAQKVIMKADWLYDAVEELSASSPDRLVITASPRQPHFSLSSVGTLGSTSIDFTRTMLETFQVPEQISNTYKFSFIKYALKAMAAASKVSIRGDNVGVLSLQFMIDHDGGATPSFIDFRFLPFDVSGGNTEDDDEGEDEGGDGDDDAL